MDIDAKKGQLTLFVIIALILIIAIIITFYIKPLKENPNKIAEIRPIESFVQGCIEKTAKNALYLIGQQGGYIEPTQLSTDYNVAYFFYDDRNTMPTKEQIENEISKYINSELPFCTNNFIELPDFDVEDDVVKTKTTILENKIRLDIKYPLTIKRGDVGYHLEYFNAEINSNLNTIHGAIEQIIIEQVKNPDRVCFSCLTNIGAENDLTIDLVDQQENTIVFTIFDDSLIIDNSSYEFMFANHYKV